MQLNSSYPYIKCLQGTSNGDKIHPEHYFFSKSLIHSINNLKMYLNYPSPLAVINGFRSLSCGFLNKSSCLKTFIPVKLLWHWICIVLNAK